VTDPSIPTGVDPADIPVVILCGGQGTRIREASEKLPKPLIDIGGRPVLWHIMKTYGAHGFRRFILCLGYKAWDIKEYFLRYQENVSDFTINVANGDGPRFHERGDLDDWDVSLVDTGMETGTGGRLARVAHLLDQPYFMVSYGDGVGGVDLAGELDHLVSAPDLMALVTGVHPTSRYGELSTDGGKVIDFAEKLPSEGWVSAGFFAFRREFLERLLDDPEHFFEQGPMQQLAKEGRLGLWEHTGFWMGMDTYREYVALNKLWADDAAEWKIW
jgi:glucose-1-phosphate cytidylyltransferase